MPEDRLHTGVAPSLSIASNIVLKSYRGRTRRAGRSCGCGGSASRAVELIERYDVKAPGPPTPARQLSGGNLQKVVLAREFSGEPQGARRRGADPRSRRRRDRDRARATSARPRRRRVAVLLISEDLDEVLTLADRIAVMYEGAIVGEVDARTATVEQLGLLMAGVRDAQP